MKCRYCLNKNIGKAGIFGKYKDKQRYKCNKCKKFSYAKRVVEQKVQDIVIESKPLKDKAGILEWLKQKTMSIWKVLR